MSTTDDPCASPASLSSADATSTPERVGTVLADRWHLDRILASGGQGTVYAATHRNGSRVAVKILHAVSARDPALIARFASEGTVGNLVDHPGAVRALDDGVTADGVPYHVMELLDGESLAERLARGPMTPSQALAVAIPVLEVLVAAHERGVVHRDIKPHNVFLSRAGGVKLLDFGVARGGLSAEKNATIVGFVLGTPAFMSPEQARGRWAEVDHRTDVFAVGAMLFTSITGRSLRNGETAAEEMIAASCPTPRMHEIAPDMPSTVAGVLDRALAYAPADRFASASEMLAALQGPSMAPARLRDGDLVTDSVEAFLPHRLERGVIVGAAVALCAVVVTATMLAMSSAGAAPVGVARSTLAVETGVGARGPEVPAIVSVDSGLPTLADDVVTPSGPPSSAGETRRAALPPRAGASEKSPPPGVATAARKHVRDPMEGRF